MFLCTGGQLKTRLERNTWLSMIVIPNSLCTYLGARILFYKSKVCCLVFHGLNHTMSLIALSATILSELSFGNS